MIATNEERPISVDADDLKKPRKRQRAIKYVSRHFTSPDAPTVPERKAKRPKVKGRDLSKDGGNRRDNSKDGGANKTLGLKSSKPGSQQPQKNIVTLSQSSDVTTNPRIFFGLNVDELSSDSDLTDVPSDIGPDPFVHSDHPSNNGPRSKRRKKTNDRAEVVAVREQKPKKAKKSGLTKSPYFPHPHKHRPTFLSTLPFPPLHLDRFGLMQERLAHEPFRLLLATIFLNKTPGSRAMPIFFELMRQYPTPEALAAAEQADVTAIIHELGFQNQRARKCIAMAQKWLEAPPVKGRRYRKLHYPKKGDGADIKADEVIDDNVLDHRVAWEISHLPGLGPYSHDSWRMFCRDEIRGLASSWNGEDARGPDFEPEWKRVLPTDKELRAWMTWMWMKEGQVWNKESGLCTKASDELMELARGKGNVVLEDANNTLVVKPLIGDGGQGTAQSTALTVETPAGEFVPNENG